MLTFIFQTLSNLAVVAMITFAAVAATVVALSVAVLGLAFRMMPRMRAAAPAHPFQMTETDRMSVKGGPVIETDYAVIQN